MKVFKNNIMHECTRFSVIGEINNTFKHGNCADLITSIWRSVHRDHSSWTREVMKGGLYSVQQKSFECHVKGRSRKKINKGARIEFEKGVCQFP